MNKTLYSAIYTDNCFPFNSLPGIKRASQVHVPEELKTNDGYLIVWGGADITPALYNHPQCKQTYSGGRRDFVEWNLMKKAQEIGLPIIGVCRGAQMLCALAGGYLLQDVQNHHGQHYVETVDGQSFRVNSIHHQMMAGLENTEHELVAWRPGFQGVPYYYRDNEVYTPAPTFKEPEFVYFKGVKGFAIQWHPEAMQRDSDATEYILNYIANTQEVTTHA